MREALEPLVYGRIILVGWGTVVGSIFVFALIDSIVRQHSLPRYLTLDFALGFLHCIWIGTAISIFLLSNADYLDANLRDNSPFCGFYKESIDFGRCSYSGGGNVVNRPVYRTRDW